MPVSRGPFDPTGIDWPPDRHLIRIDLSISTPQPTVRAGATLSYFVTVRNASGEDYPLTPCPDYAEDLTAVKTAGWFYQLNCSPAGAVRAGASVTFQMRLDVPANAPAGATTLLWQLFDGRVLTDDYAQAPITITA
jgi:hypothetical protein